MNHTEVISRYANQKINPRTKSVEWSGSSVYCYGDVIYSYGSHFPMAKRINSEICEYIRNSDRYSVSTSRHQNLVASYCPGPELPRVALQNIGVDFLDLTKKNLLFWRAGFSKYVFQNPITKEFYDDLEYISSNRDAGVDVYHTPNKDAWQPPALDGKFKPSRRRIQVGKEIYEQTWATGWFTINQLVVLSHKKKYFLIEHDEISLIPKKPVSIFNAIEIVLEKESKKLLSNLLSTVGAKALATLG